MAETKVIFLTSYTKAMLKDFKIFIYKKEQSKFFSFEKGDYIIYVNEIILPENLNGDISNIDIMIKYKKDEQKVNYYKIKSKAENDDIIFLFDYGLENTITKKIYFINMNFFYFWKNDEKYINESYSIDEKFSWFYMYILNKRNEEKKYYIKLIKNYIKQKEKEDINYKIPIDIGISILIRFEESLGQCIPIIKRINKNVECNYIDINSSDNEPIYLQGIVKCLDKLINFQNDEKNLIIEILFIYFIKYRNGDIEVLLNGDYLKILLELFEQKNLYIIRTI